MPQQRTKHSHSDYHRHLELVSHWADDARPWWWCWYGFIRQGNSLCNKYSGCPGQLQLPQTLNNASMSGPTYTQPSVFLLFCRMEIATPLWCSGGGVNHPQQSWLCLKPPTQRYLNDLQFSMLWDWEQNPSWLNDADKLFRWKISQVPCRRKVPSQIMTV